jgi:hypothetical protein
MSRPDGTVVSETVGKARIDQSEEDISPEAHPSEKCEDRHEQPGEPEGSQGKMSRPVFSMDHGPIITHSGPEDRSFHTSRPAT